MEKNGALESEMLPRTRRRWCVAALDFLLSFFCATLPVACGWKGLWILLDAVIYPDWTLPSAWTSFVIGVIGVYFQSFFRDHMQADCFSRGAGTGRHLLARLLVLVMWFGVVNKWRGIFLLMDTDSGLGWKSYLLFLVAGLLVLVKLGLLATVVALPLSCDLEPDHTFFHHETPLSTTRKDSYQLRALDAFLAVVITCFSTFVWRGLWGVFDKLLIPDQPGWSALLSLVLGFVVTAVCFGLQFPVVALLRPLQFGWALLLRTILVLVGTVGVINVWRGAFLVFDTYLTEEHVTQPLRLGAAAAVAGGCALMLMLLRLSKNLLLWGVQRDLPYSLPFNCAVAESFCSVHSNKVSDSEMEFRSQADRC